MTRRLRHCAGRRRGASLRDASPHGQPAGGQGVRPPSHRRQLLAACMAACVAAPALAVDTQVSQQKVVINGSLAAGALLGAADSASEGLVTARQLEGRPLLRPAELLEAMPGMVVTQHSGDGKANQYFLRGFNLDHGSDFATFVAGMPVNMASHAHGQGYTDLNFLVPELVNSMRYRKGAYTVEDGDFATAASVRIDYLRGVERPFALLEVGAHDFRRALAVGGSAPEADSRWLYAVELQTNDGPWTQPERLRKHNAVLRWSQGTASDGLALTLMGYQARWTATEHVPERAITSGEIGRYGALVPDDGGTTHRVSLSAEWGRSTERSATTADAYAIGYGLNLFSNPSGYINGPQGDQHEQADRRVVWGGRATHRWTLGDADDGNTDAALGAQLRQDRVGTLGLYDTEARVRTHTVREDRLLQTQLGLFGELRTRWANGVRASAGLRWDTVQARLTPTGGDFNAANGGRARDSQWSPKLGLAYAPGAGTELYANVGRGFHSNDARGRIGRVNPADGSALEPVPFFARATTSEVGLRAVPRPDWRTSVSLWQMRLASELVFIGDEGVTEPKGASRRVGIEWSNSMVLAEGLAMDADLAWSRARFAQPVNGGRQVPNAVPLVGALAFTAGGQGPWTAGLRLRYIGRYALEETGTERSRAVATANLKLGWRPRSGVEVSMEALNLFGSRANDIEYWGAACTRTDGPGCNNGEGIDGRLVHPLEPRTFRIALKVLL